MPRSLLFWKAVFHLHHSVANGYGDAMSDNLRTFTRAVYVFDAVVQRTPAESWDEQTPCTDWTARQLVAHQIGILNSIRDFAGGGEPHMPITPDDDNDPVGSWNVGRDEVLAALDSEGALHQEDEYWFGPMSVDALIGVVQWDPLTHAWDLGRAVGLEPHLAEDIAAICLANVEVMGDAWRGFGLISDPVEVGADAGIVDRYLAAVGRDPAC
jgi:uncharacterized protein (TIGR03086 family)